jgi:hypothetical protein
MVIAQNVRKSLIICAAASVGGFGFLATQTIDEVRADSVTTGVCSVDVAPTTGVSVSVANDGDCVVKFTSSTTVTWTRPANISTYEVLVVAGGGGGGAHHNENPGGGGGGGVVHVPEMSLNESSYEIQVGPGGIGNNAIPPRCAQHPWYAGESGRHSYFGATLNSPLITAFGGGGGGGACEFGFSGGSGGGGHCAGGRIASNAGEVSGSITGARLYGNDGGSPDSCSTGSGGGGGASTRGEDGTATKAGDGGEGISLNVLGSGSPIVYGSGGGSAPGASASIVGQGGTNGGDAKVGDGPTGPEHQGVDETGSGGGAQRCPTRPLAVPCPAGRGGDGVVIIRYSLSSAVIPAPANNVVDTPVQADTVAPAASEPIQQVATTPTRRVNHNKKATKPTSAPKTVGTTTIPVSTTTAPAQSPSAPTAPETQPGEAKLVINGEAAEMSVTRRDNQLLVSNGALSSSVAAVTANGTRRPLDSQGNVRFEDGDSLELLATGFASDSDLEVWIFSEPKDLGIIRTSSVGEAESVLTVPTDIEPGNHRVVVSGTSRSGSKVVVAVGVVIAAASDGVSTAEKFAIALPITTAILAALIIPTRRRRRSEVL